MSKKLRLTQSLRAALVALTIGLFGCHNLGSIGNTSAHGTLNSGEQNANVPRVVATTSILCDLTKQIAEETIHLTCLIPPDTNPYFYQPKPEDQEAIQEAKLILFSGYNLEPNLLKLMKASKSSASKIAVAQRAVPQPLNFEGEDTTVSDPYVWHNAKNGIRMVDVISNNLSKVVPENASLYSKNAVKVKNELTKLDDWIKSRISSVPAQQRELITTHDAMGYYAKAYGLSYESALEAISDTEKPSATRVQALATYIKKSKIPTLFTETTTKNSNWINSVTQNTKAKVSQRKLFVNNLGAPGSEGDTYQKMMVANTRTIVEGLGGTYLIFEPTLSSSQQKSDGGNQ
ncbi:metal ABC transporter solute-binding protein, Zn/Mn family [Brasilonema bromeliae]|uniref:Metal ABC transporter substrate-binding protein n=1 Tax=Brasilonema bromeliae SPC951 TaxID=385972 RepID=A0ABX1PE75_9CYAN|nr:zinc ABC transporter substrate-binding protein [Brasilonema bromeliae]NMG22087.1 metal ABC transporter substrate-binding protein [Brasilonema bromeliae SPC951]